MNNSVDSGTTDWAQAATRATIDESLVINWPMPVWLMLLLAIATMLTVTWLYQSERGSSRQRMRWSLIALRTSILLLVLWMMTGWNWQRAKIELPELVIAIDVSDSMLTLDEVTTPEGGKLCDRIERVQQLLNLSDRQWQELEDRYRLRVTLIAEDDQPLNLGTQEVATKLSELRRLKDSVGSASFSQHSRLGDSIIHVIEGQAGRGTAAILFLSDGVSTAGQNLNEAGLLARRSGIPAHTICIGRPQAHPDLRIGDILVEEQVFLGDQVSLDATVLAKELTGGVSGKLKLLEVGSDRVLDEQSFELQPTDDQANVSLRFEPQQPGKVQLQIVVQPLPEETDTVNNKSLVQLQVQDRIIRVLMVFAQPGYEFRYLKHFLERARQNGPDKKLSFELISVLQSGDPSYAQQDSTARRFVSSEPAELSQFDTFVFGPLDANMITRNSQQAIVRAVTHGGSGSIFLGWSEELLQQLKKYPLSGLLPVDQVMSDTTLHKSFEVEATKIGQSALPVSTRDAKRPNDSSVEPLIPLESLLRIDSLKPGAQILATAVSVSDARRSPLIVAQFAGAGRTCFIATDETYRWTTAYGSDQTHQRFWGQMLRWVSRGKLNSLNDTELTVEPKQPQEGKPIRFQLRLPLGQDLPREAEIKLEGGATEERTVQLQRLVEKGTLYQAELDQLASGDYRAILINPPLATPPSLEFSIAAAPTEQADLRADQESMQQLADLSLGRAYQAIDAEGWLENLPSGKPVRLGNLPAQPLWNQPWVAILFVSLLTAEWLLRRHARML